MRYNQKKISPEEFILSALDDEERLKSAFKVAQETFKKTKLSIQDIEKAVKKVRGSSHAKSSR
ncbi:MAG: hypothetical protein HQM15_00755 [Deltaproteobacteria bacterium]|nr:hypothetical protein [Deltaproteobacteria bacterium]